VRHGVGIATLVASLALAACSGGKDASGDPPADGLDHSATFVGMWQGSMNVTSNGQSDSVSGVYTPISRLGFNSLLIGFCDDGSGPTADVLSDSSFRMSGVSCLPVPATGCSAVTLVVNEGGTGSLLNGMLTLGMSGYMTGCGRTVSYTMTFSGAKSTALEALTAEGEGIAAALGERVGPTF
jgi:hypothetical protein